MLEGLIHALTHLARCRSSINGYGARAQHRLYWVWSIGTRDDFSQEVVAVGAASPWQSLRRAGLSSCECFHWQAAKEVLVDDDHLT